MDKKLRNKEVVTGELVGLDPKDALLESAPESARWNPVPGSAGTQAPETGDDDEDDEGRSKTEQLYAEGAEEAARDQMQKAAQAAKKIAKDPSAENS